MPHFGRYFLAPALLSVTLSCHAATYTCKDSAGKWSEAACKGRAAPPAKVVKTDPYEWKPTIGMRKAEVEAAVAAGIKAYNDGSGRAPGEWIGYSAPEINKTTTKYGAREQWVFEHGARSRYLYIENGVVTAIQE